MDKIVYEPRPHMNSQYKFEPIVCVKKYEIYVENGIVKYAVLQGGCNGGSQTIVRVAQQLGDIEKIIKVLGAIKCGGSHRGKTSCAQQFAYVLYMYLLTLKGKKLPKKDADRLIVENNISAEEVIDIEEKIETKEKLYTKKNKFLNL